MGDEEGTSNGGGTEGTEGFHYLKSEAMNSSSNNNNNNNNNNNCVGLLWV